MPNIVIIIHVKILCQKENDNRVLTRMTKPICSEARRNQGLS